MRALGASQLTGSLFGSDLSYGDVIENFFAWEGQTLIGTQPVDRIECVVLESKPGKDQKSEFASVRSWVDTRRLVPLRIEKYLPSGELARRIDTTLVVRDDKGRNIPGNLNIRGFEDESTTQIEGSKLRHGVGYDDREFTPEGLGDTAPPRTASD